MQSQLIFWRILLAITIAIMIVAILQVIPIAAENGIALQHSNWTYFWVLPLALSVGLFALSWNKCGERLVAKINSSSKVSFFWRLVAFMVFMGAILIFPFLILYPHYLDIAQGSSVQVAAALRILSAAVYKLYIRGLIFWLLTLLGMISLKFSQKDFSWHFSLAVSVVVQAATYSLISIFSLVNNYPFSLGWSDTTNYYRASILFASQIYGMKMALPIMHATQNFLLAVPFLFGNLPIWVHRAWEAILTAGFPIALGVVFIHRMKLSDRRLFWPMVAWAVLFLMQGPIHIHLLACAIIFVLGVKPQKFWLTTLVVLLASIWAGMSRINWYPVPGLIAAVLYLLEIPYEASRSWLRYLWKPFLWFILGIVTAFASQFIYVLVSGNASHPGDAFSSLTSDLLWYRLFPNATNLAGILPSAFIVSLPLLALIIYSLWQRQGIYHPLRLTGIFTALLVLFLGGLVVSIKIGGGSDLHNLDAYLILLMLVSGYLYFGCMAPETGKVYATISYPAVLNVLAIILPVWMAVKSVNPILTWDRPQVNKILESVRNQIESVGKTGGEVLFITQRQLLALKMVNVPLVPDYEQDYLMEMVMSHNRPYLDRFQQDLQAQRFKMIVASAYSHFLQGSGRAFGNENDLWVQEIVIPLNCYYQEVPGYKNQPVALYIPRDQPCK